MKNRAILMAACCALGGTTMTPRPAVSQDQSVATYHGQADRSGHYVVAGLTWERGRAVHADARFHAAIAGHVYAQPLYWRPDTSGAPGLLIVATEGDSVYALNAETGAVVWQRSMGTSVPRSALPCGDIDPLGITGTPAIDEGTGTLYLDAMVAGEGSRGPQHLIFALSLRDGATVAGWPVDVADALGAHGIHFAPELQNERGALLVRGDRVYVPYGGHWGDCGQYHGWVVGVDRDRPESIVAWSTRGAAGGIWAPGGIAADDQSLYVVTGNTMNATTWADGEAIIRLTPDLQNSGQPKDFMAPADWQALDGHDADLGSVGPLPITLQRGDPSSVILAIGKDGKAYLADRANLGGIGGQLATLPLADRAIKTAPATWNTSDGVRVAVQADRARCPGRGSASSIVALEIVAASPPKLQVAWCAALDGAGAPVVTTSDDHSDPIVWVAAAEGDGLLHGYRGDSGEELFASDRAAPMRGLHRVGTILVADHRLYVSGDGGIYAFTF